MTSDDYWPEGEAYKTPPPEPESLPICPRCGRGHLKALPDCNRTNTREQHYGRWTD